MIGSLGWQHPVLVEQFYPVDLPEDWQLVFYGNEFPVVMISAQVCAALSDTALSSWEENSSDEFRFILEVAGSVAVDRLQFSSFLQMITPLQGKIAALVLSCEESNLERILSATQCQYPRIVDMGDEPPGERTVSLCVNEGVGIVTHAGGDIYPISSTIPVLLRIPDAGSDLKTMRRILEQCLKQTSNQQPVYLIFIAQPPPVEFMEQAKTLLELL